MKLKITGTNDTMKEIAKMLVDQYIPFKYDGKNKIVADHHLTERGIEFKEVFEKYIPKATVVKVETKTCKKVS